MDHPSVITEHISGGSGRVSHRGHETINVTLSMSDGGGTFLFCAPGSESSSHERRRAVLYRKQNGNPLFLPPTNSLTPRSFSFSWCWRISTPRASPRLSTPYRERRPAPGRACGGGHSGGLPLAVGDTGAGVHRKRRRVPAAPSAAGHPLHPLP